VDAAVGQLIEAMAKDTLLIVLATMANTA